ncbi:MAG: hypothetical protein ABSG68_19135 [Thermoguttaceae bacterium]|jgi:hypothetical protein
MTRFGKKQWTFAVLLAAAVLLGAPLTASASVLAVAQVGALNFTNSGGYADIGGYGMVVTDVADSTYQAMTGGATTSGGTAIYNAVYAEQHSTPAWSGLEGITSGSLNVASPPAHMTVDWGLDSNLGYSSFGEVGGSPLTIASSAQANTAIVRYSYVGDGDLNGKVDANDYTRWLTGFGGSAHASKLGTAGGDYNGDGTVDANDYTAWLTSFGSNLPPLATTSVATGGGAALATGTPEPGTIGLLLVAVLAGLARFGLKRRVRGR